MRQAEAYWDAVADKRRLRNAKRRTHRPIALADYVLTQPPVYSGPPRADRSRRAAAETGREGRRSRWSPISSTTPPSNGASCRDQPASEADFKRAYARAAAAAGLTRAQVVGVYAFETGGNGAYDTQAGVTPTRPAAISPALGYNQLLSTNTRLAARRARQPHRRGIARQGARAFRRGAERHGAQERGAQPHDRFRRAIPHALERL